MRISNPLFATTIMASGLLLSSTANAQAASNDTAGKGIIVTGVFNAKKIEPGYETQGKFGVLAARRRVLQFARPSGPGQGGRCGGTQPTVLRRPSATAFVLDHGDSEVLRLRFKRAGQSPN
jgi:hypothetical protein